MKHPSANSLPQCVVDKMQPADRKTLGLETRAELDAAYEAANEREMQRMMESWLRQRGYWPRTPEFLTGGKPDRGWYVHLNEAKRNPIVLDLLVIGLDGRCIEIELKTATGRIRPEQAAMLAAGGSVALCRSAMEAMKTVEAWEMAENKSGRAV